MLGAKSGLVFVRLVVLLLAVAAPGRSGVPALAAAAVTTPEAAPAETDPEAAPAVTTPEAPADTSVAGAPDSVAALPVSEPAPPVSEPAPPVPEPAPRVVVIRAAQEPPDRPPWAALAAPGDTLGLSRDEAERTGAHLPLELLALVPGAHALEASGTAPPGALALAGSFATPEITSDGWPVRLPRLEGRDLSSLLFDRLGPGPTLIPLVAPGELNLLDGPGWAHSAPSIRFMPAEPASDSSHSRVSAYYGGSELTGGGLVFSDRRGKIDYALGVDNSGTDRFGALNDVSTRLAMIDAAGATPWGRVALSLRGTEADLEWANGRRLKHDDQGAAVEAIAADTLGPAWSLRFSVLDDRLSGSEFPGREFRRKEARIEARGWVRARHPAWFRVVGERDWLAVRFAGGVFAPRVHRMLIEGGAELDLGAARVHAASSLRASDRHPARPGGRVAIEMPLAGRMAVGAGASRVHRPPTLDQEVLVAGRPPAEPERHDAAEVWLTRRAPLGIGLLAARRWLAHQAAVEKVSDVQPWPQFEFQTSSPEHWEVRGILSTPAGPLGISGGIWGSHYFSSEDSLELHAFIPETVARAFVALRLDFLDGDLVVRPRLEGLAVGESRDFARRRLPGHGRLDATLIAIIGHQLDLELRMRNALDRRYPLAVLDVATDNLILDSGRQLLVGLRWRLTN